MEPANEGTIEKERKKLVIICAAAAAAAATAVADFADNYLTKQPYRDEALRGWEETQRIIGAQVELQRYMATHHPPPLFQNVRPEVGSSIPPSVTVCGRVKPIDDGKQCRLIRADFVIQCLIACFIFALGFALGSFLY